MTLNCFKRSRSKLDKKEPKRASTTANRELTTSSTTEAAYWFERLSAAIDLPRYFPRPDRRRPPEVHLLGDKSVGTEQFCQWYLAGRTDVHLLWHQNTWFRQFYVLRQMHECVELPL